MELRDNYETLAYIVKTNKALTPLSRETQRFLLMSFLPLQQKVILRLRAEMMAMVTEVREQNRSQSRGTIRQWRTILHGGETLNSRMESLLSR